MIPFSSGRVLTWLGVGAWLACAGWVPCAAAEPADSHAPAREHRAWQQAAELSVDEALATLPAPESATNPAERRALAYARGVCLLNAQPRLQRNIDEARSLLEAVQHAGADDDLGLRALYYLARIAQFHALPRDPARAIALYEELIARAPAHPLAEQAVSRLAALQIFADATPDERRARLTEAEAAAPRLQAAAARRDIHFVLYEAHQCFTNDKEKMLEHLLAAEAAGILRQQLVADTTMQIALLARDLGRFDIARAHYEKFLASFQRDSRAYMLAGQLRDLPPSPASTPPAR